MLQRLQSPPPGNGLWHAQPILQWVASELGVPLTERSLHRFMARWQLQAEPEQHVFSRSAYPAAQQWLKHALPLIEQRAKHTSGRVLWGGLKTTGTHSLLYAHTPRGRQLWLAVPYPATAEHFIAFLNAFF
ncbi:hypothetical protein MBH78_21320 [Oceanimonas sp. NS1]|nr:hypothetical protein [Oceanimonas sp. NS1]